MHSAPADAMIVVSDIGDTWSPQTAPAMHAEMEMMRSGAVAGNTAMQIGMSMPNVPQEVPVAKASNAATMNIIAGNNICRPEAVLDTTSDTYSAAPSESVMLFSVHARVRISMAGTMASKPLIRQLMALSNFSVRRATNIAIVRINAASEPITSPTEALLAANASTKLW